MAKTPSPSFPTLLALAATCAAYRINGGRYIKYDVPSTIWDQETQTQVPNPNHILANKNIVLKALTNNELITEADHNQAVVLQSYFQSMIVKILAETLEGFEHKMFTLATGDSTSADDRGVIAYMPQHYAIKSAQQAVADRLEACQRDHIAQPNDRIQTNLEVVRTVYSQKYSCFYISGITDDNKRVLFAYSGTQPIELSKKYSIKATVKRHDSDWVTVLGRVKPTEICQ
jgi:hypothetical protein